MVEVRGDYPSIADVDVELRKTQAEADRIAEELIQNNANLNRVGDTSFTASRPFIVIRERLTDELNVQTNKLKKLEEILSTHKELNRQRAEVFKMEAGAIIKEDLGGTAAKRGDIDREEADCNSGNVFKCGKPKVSIFGGNGEGAVGDVILGNFIQELDTTISKTEYKKVVGTKTFVRIGDYYVKKFKGQGGRTQSRYHVLQESGKIKDLGKSGKPSSGRQFSKSEIEATAALIKSEETG